MRYAFSVLALCLLMACGSGGVSSSGTSRLPSTPTPPSAPSNQSFSSMLNSVRASNGAGPVTYDSRLGAAAQAHADDMLAIDHRGLSGSTFGQRIRAQGYDLRTGAENIAQGYSDEANVMQGWTNSSGHHANNINPNYQEFGLGKAGSGSAKRWVLLLATER